MPKLELNYKFHIKVKSTLCEGNFFLTNRKSKMLQVSRAHSTIKCNSIPNVAKRLLKEVLYPNFSCYP